MTSDRWLLIGGALLLSGCMTLKAYDGQRRPPDELARVQGDYKVRAGAPVSLLLRQVDGMPLDIRYSAVDLLPGPHTLLVDCTVTGSSASRHRLQVDLYAASRYVLVAETGPGNRECADVRLISASP